jgi:lipid-A-disaccharide synthase
MERPVKKILIIAGEVSGDRHAAELVSEIKKSQQQVQFMGIGGHEMKNSGVELIYHISQFAVLGLMEIIRHIPFFKSVLSRIKKEMDGLDAVILVDYPGFNLRIARIAKKRGLPVIYYICPQMWAWGERRIKKFRKYVDLPIVIFKFEEAFFQKHGIKAHFVGHPLLDQIKDMLSEKEFRQRYMIPERAPILGIFPGSRQNEVEKLLPTMAEAANRLRSKNPNIVAVIANAPHLSSELFAENQSGNNSSLIIKENVHALMKHSYAALVASGTATLELGYLRTPAVVLYKVSPGTYFLGRLLVKIKTIALANIVLGKKVFPELIQQHASAEEASEMMLRYFEDKEYYKSVKGELGGIAKALEPPGASARAAALIKDFFLSLGEKESTSTQLSN